MSEFDPPKTHIYIYTYITLFTYIIYMWVYIANPVTVYSDTKQSVTVKKTIVSTVNKSTGQEYLFKQGMLS
jgi:hypothetical protein